MVKNGFRYFPKIKIFSRKSLVKRSYAKQRVGIFYVFLFAFSLAFTTFVHVPITSATAPATYQVTSNPQTLMQQGKAFYDAGQFAEAATVLQQAADEFKAQGNELQQAIALTNLALAYQQLAQWNEAQDAIASSLQLVQNASTTDPLKVKGAALDVQGQLYLAQGQPESALESFSSAATTYAKAGDDSAVIRSHINQAQALQANGLYRRALDSLKEVSQTLYSLPDSPLKAAGLRSFGNGLRLVGNLDESENVLKESLAVAQRYGATQRTTQPQSLQDVSAALLSLGNTARAKADISAALNYYQQAAAVPTSATTRIQAQLNQLSLLVEAGQFSEAQRLVSEIQPVITQLPPSRISVEARINFARSLMKLGEMFPRNSATSPFQAPELSAIAQQLSTAVQQAKRIQDPRAESYALGQLGALYEQTQQLSAAQDMTEQALLLAQSINAPHIAYRWQWQLGRLLNAQGKTEGALSEAKRQSAIAAYTSAIRTLQDLRGDIVAINPDVQFSFRESVEPVYRELVSLLLQSKGSRTNEKNLSQAREVIEALQQAELVNFFREDCLNATAVQIDQVDQQAAVIYPIVLKDRLEVILSLPNAPLRHYAAFLPEAEVEAVFTQLRDAIAPHSVDPTRSIGVQGRECGDRSLGVQGRECAAPPASQEYLPLSQQVYDWLIRPAEQDIAASEAKTLVFVLDTPMLNLPMAVLHNGKQFLIENYAIAYTPGLQLLDPKPLARGELSALKAGLSEGRQGFPPLPFVEEELVELKSEISGELLLNQDFTSTAIKQEIDSVPFPVVHLATHGQFSSNAEDTFILTWDDRLNVNQLNSLLQTREVGDRGAIELLVLSACQTAAGDKRAALGLAGVAVRAGARSTLATLWFVSDKATAELMVRFYRELADTTITKAEALRRAQLALLQDTEYQLPIYWAPYVLVGNWR